MPRGRAPTRRQCRDVRSRKQGWARARSRPAIGLRAGARAAYAPRMPSPPATPVRRALAADLGPLLALEEATFDTDRISRAQWRRHVAGKTATVLVIGAAGHIDAAAVVCYRRNSRAARLYSLAVHRDARGRQLGARLLAAVEADARARGCTAMRLEVHVRNTAAIALYEHRGYVRGERLARFYEDGADAFRYAKPLTAVTP